MLTINRATSEMSPPMMWLVTGKAMVNNVWNKKVPRITWPTVALARLAQPKRMAATAGKAIIKGAMYSCKKP